MYHLGQIQYTVMPYGITLGPILFQELMSIVLDIGKFVVTYLDDVMLYSRSIMEHMEHMFFCIA